MSLFEWDQQKNDANKLKHGISFEDTLPVFHDEQAVTIEDSHHGEQRWKTLGMGKSPYNCRRGLLLIGTKFALFQQEKPQKQRGEKYESRR